MCLLSMNKIQMSPSEGAPEEFDQTIFPVDHNRSIGPAEGLALNLVREAQRYSASPFELSVHYVSTSPLMIILSICLKPWKYVGIDKL